MKSFLFSLILFIILISIVIANSIYVHKVCESISEQLSVLSIDNPQSAEDLCTLWRSHRDLLSLSVHESKLERMDDLTENIKSAVAQGDGAEFKKALVLICELLDELAENEEISLQGIV